MTLSVVWREQDNIHLASDSRLSFGPLGMVDCGIKVSRFPVTVRDADEAGVQGNVVWSGELGVTFAGLATDALMLRDAVAEAVYALQVAEPSNFQGMETLSIFLRDAFILITAEQWPVTGPRSPTAIIFSGWCVSKDRYHAFYFKRTGLTSYDFREVAMNDGEFMAIGSGSTAFNKIVIAPARQRAVIEALELVINDPAETAVGGNVQYGRFKGEQFQPHGVARVDQGMSYWRGLLDLNHPEFMGKNGIMTNFPFLDRFSQ